LGDDGRLEVAGEGGTSTAGCVAVCDGLERGSGEEPCEATRAGGLACAVSDAAWGRLPVRSDTGRRGGRGRPGPRAGRARSNLVGAPLRGRVDGGVANGPRARVHGWPRAPGVRHLVGRDLMAGLKGLPRLQASPRPGRISPRRQADRGRGRAGAEVDRAPQRDPLPACRVAPRRNEQRGLLHMRRRGRTQPGQEGRQVGAILRVRPPRAHVDVARHDQAAGDRDTRGGSNGRVGFRGRAAQSA
jgi:hypothetical protein